MAAQSPHSTDTRYSSDVTYCRGGISLLLGDHGEMQLMPKIRNQHTCAVAASRHRIHCLMAYKSNAREGLNLQLEVKLSVVDKYLGTSVQVINVHWQQVSAR